jgi:hypothetical protein
MNPTKTFTLLSQIPKVVIGKCSAILPNKMQCWRAGDVQVHTVTQGVNSEEPNDTFDYQLCRAHAIAEQQEYDKAVADEAEAAKAAAAVIKDEVKK